MLLIEFVARFCYLRLLDSPVNPLIRRSRVGAENEFFESFASIEISGVIGSIFTSLDRNWTLQRDCGGNNIEKNSNKP